MFQKKNKKTVAESKSPEPYAEIVGVGSWGYIVTVARDYTEERCGYAGTYSYDRTYIYKTRRFLFGRKRAERYAKRRLDIAKREYDHKKFKKSITLN